MYDKIYADVFFPTLNKKYNFALPAGISIEASIGLMAEIIREKEQIRLESKGLLLFDMEKRALLDFSGTVLASGIVDGKKLMLV